MNRQLFEKIQTYHHTSEGREKLFYDLASVETGKWEEIESQKIANWTEVFVQKAAAYASRVVITEVDTENSYSYRELDEASEKIKAFILATTDEPHIGLHYRNSFDFMTALIGINKAGRIAILFNNREPESRLVKLAETTKVDLVLVDYINLMIHRKPILI